MLYQRNVFVIFLRQQSIAAKMAAKAAMVALALVS
jgi:hypothetical protein